MKQRLGAFAKTKEVSEKKKKFTVELIISEEGDEDEALSQCHSVFVCNLGVMMKLLACSRPLTKSTARSSQN